MYLIVTFGIVLCPALFTGPQMMALAQDDPSPASDEKEEIWRKKIIESVTAIQEKTRREAEARALELEREKEDEILRRVRDETEKLRREFEGALAAEKKKWKEAAVRGEQENQNLLLRAKEQWARDEALRVQAEIEKVRQAYDAERPISSGGGAGEEEKSFLNADSEAFRREALRLVEEEKKLWEDEAGLRLKTEREKWGREQDRRLREEIQRARKAWEADQARMVAAPDPALVEAQVEVRLKEALENLQRDEANLAEARELFAREVEEERRLAAGRQGAGDVPPSNIPKLSGFVWLVAGLIFGGAAVFFIRSIPGRRGDSVPSFRVLSRKLNQNSRTFAQKTAVETQQLKVFRELLDKLLSESGEGPTSDAEISKISAAAGFSNAPEELRAQLARIDKICQENSALAQSFVAISEEIEGQLKRM